MRYATFSLTNDASERLGLYRNDVMIDVHALLSARTDGTPRTLLELIEQGRDGWTRLAQRLNQTLAGAPPGATAHPPDAVHWHAPIRRPRKNIVCLGLNYMSHAKESAQARGREFKVPEAPVFFTKATTSVNGPNDPIPWDSAITAQLDYEAELGVVIGVTGINIPRARALEHVFGYTVINDISARELQKTHLQWFKGKSLDGSCPIGPVIVTADEFGDPQSKQLMLRVNGVEKQHSTTANMIFSVAAIIESLSQGLTVEAGDIIATGTPEGVGLGRTPPEFLADGDVVETEVEGIGVLRNKVVKNVGR
jgi:2-keto-4-pentenoate hydratase/2-oxohepta-3-ene-1,7-dioic acid hydratase in catechol pathway